MMKCYLSIKNYAIAMLLLLSASMTNAVELSGHIGGFIGLKTMNNGD